ncbi:MAG: 3-isopropylmalate dehydratase small subunit [Bacillota bacterium]
MQPFSRHTGLVAPLDRANVDTDQLVPKQFLKRLERTGFGQFLFWHWRYDQSGAPIPDFVLNQERYRNASILVGGRNFGSGSSREHAVWALTDYGFRVVISAQFADIFFNNSFKNGLLLVTLSDFECQTLMQRAAERSDYRLTVDLTTCSVTDDDGFAATFEVDPFRRHCLLNGLDDIGLTLEHLDKIEAFERRRGTW